MIVSQDLPTARKNAAPDTAPVGGPGRCWGGMASPFSAAGPCGRFEGECDRVASQSAGRDIAAASVHCAAARSA